MKEKGINHSHSALEEAKTVFRKQTYALKKGGRHWNVIGSFRNDAKVHKALLNRLSELAIEKTANAKSGTELHAILNSSLFAPVKNMVKQIQIAGVNLTINPSLPSLENDPFILEKVRQANLRFSNKG